jgi:hypothetical protein
VQKLGTATESGVTLRNEGVAFPRSSFGINQRLFNIYDGPAYQSSNAYLNVKKVTIADSCAGQSCAGQPFLVAPILGLPKDPVTKKCIMPNAAIGWKQPNGFYYPPAFHSDNLYFQNVDIRHYVTQPLFVARRTRRMPPRRRIYCNWNSGCSTALLTSTADGTQRRRRDADRACEHDSVNRPVLQRTGRGAECIGRDRETSLYDYVTSVVYPAASRKRRSIAARSLPGAIPPDATTPLWNTNARTSGRGVPLSAVRRLPGGTATNNSIRMSGRMGSEARCPRTTAHYIDTTISAVDQAKIVEPPVAPNAAMLSVFEAGKDYYSFMIYAKPTSRQTTSLRGDVDWKNDPDGFDVTRTSAGDGQDQDETARVRGHARGELAQDLAAEVRSRDRHPRSDDGHERQRCVRDRL